MKTKDFDFDLPENLIAQKPIENRDHSKLMIVDRKTGKIEHRIFKDILEYLREGDCLVLNDTKVLPARLFGIKDKTRGKVEFLLLKKIDAYHWEVLVKPGKRAQVGDKIIFGEGVLEAQIIHVNEDGSRIAEFQYHGGTFEEILDQLGVMPLPPYIKETLTEKERYQTVYSKHDGSVAAPTAGLHFTERLLDQIRQKGVQIAFITLHIGLGTFRPVKTEEIEAHAMHSEFYQVNEEAANLINSTKRKGGRIIAVGTTSTRTLESIADEQGIVHPGQGWTDLFIYPGYTFKVIDGLVTNFHLPKSTLIMLVSAFAGYDNTMAAYSHAVKEKYRFYSFGDSMLIL